MLEPLNVTIWGVGHCIVMREAELPGRETFVVVIVACVIEVFVAFRLFSSEKKHLGLNPQRTVVAGSRLRAWTVSSVPPVNGPPEGHREIISGVM